jgi:hypothetical protein
MTSITLNVEFDVEQDSQRLAWSFNGPQGRIARTGAGVETGLLAFNPGDTVAVSIVANSYSRQLESARIIDCHLITRPVLNSWTEPTPGQYPLPSPFFGQGSAGAVTSFLPVSGMSPTASQQSFTGQILHVVNPGRWQTSFVMTVAITTTGGRTTYRVFTFDPECQVSTGVD